MAGYDELGFDAALDLWRQSRGPNPRPARRVEDREAGVEKCARDRCRVCGATTGSYARHHLVPKSQRGDDVDDNLVRLCDPWEPYCHHRVTTNDPAALAAVRASLSPSETAYVIRKQGVAWLERRYPESEETRS